MSLTVTHRKVTSGTVNDDVEVDLADWNDTHAIDGAPDVAFGDRIELQTGETDPDHGKFVIGVADSGNPYLDIGYNIEPVNWTLINPDERGLFFGQEGDYDDGSGHRKMEQYWQYQRASGQVPVADQATYCRTLMAQYDKVTNLPTALFLSSGVTNGIQMNINDGTGNAVQEQVVGKTKAQLTGTSFNVFTQPGAVTTALAVASAPSGATGVQISSLASGSGAGIVATSSASNEALSLNGKGSGGVTIASNGGVVRVGNSSGTAAEATNRGNLTLYSGQNDAATNGLEFKSSTAAAGFGFRIATVYDGGSNMDLKFQNRQNSADWTDIFKFAGANGNMNILASASATGSIKSSNATAGIGYATGAGGAITQATSRTTGVTLNKASGAITLVSAVGSASYQTFTVTNSAVAATDTIIVNQKSGTDKYIAMVTRVAAGTFDITYATTGGTTTEQPVFNFAVIKAVAS